MATICKRHFHLHFLVSTLMHFVDICSQRSNQQKLIQIMTPTLQWRHNECDGVSNHQHHDSLLNGLFKHRSKKTSKVRVTGPCVGNSPVTVTLKMFPFDDVIMEQVQAINDGLLYWRIYVSLGFNQCHLRCISWKKQLGVLLQRRFKFFVIKAFSEGKLL